MTDSIAPISPTSHSNFSPHNLRPGTEAFFNSDQFMANQTAIFSFSVNNQTKILEKASQQIKDSIE